MAAESPSVIWLFGMPCSGKTTLARALRDALRAEGRSVCMLEGDVIRRGLSCDLDFSDEGRSENIRRAAHVAKMLAEQGHTVIAAFVTPGEARRDLVRQILGGDVLLAHLNCPLEVCLSRDARGVYGRAMQGAAVPDAQNLFESPASADVTLPTDQINVAESVRRLLTRLGNRPKTAAPEMVDLTGVRRLTFKEGWLRVMLGTVLVAALGIAVFFGLQKREEAEPAPHADTLKGRNSGKLTLSQIAQLGMKSSLTPEADGQSLKFVVSNPENSEGVKALTLRNLERFWQASNWKEKLRYVRSPERVAGEMKDYYEVHHRTEPKPGTLQMSVFQAAGNAEMLHLGYGVPQSNELLEIAMIKHTDGSYRLDWESYTGAGDMDWEDFKKDKPSQPVQMRAYLTADDYYNYEFADKERYRSFRLTSADGEQTVNAYCEKGSVVATEATTIAERNKDRKCPVTALLAFPEKAKSNNCVMLVKIVADRWLLVE